MPPTAVAMLGAWACAQRALGRDLLVDSSLQTPAAYASGLLSALAGREFGGGSDAAFFRVRLESEIPGQTERAVERLGLPHDAERIVAYAIGELARNVLDHAATNEQGAFCALDARSNGRVRLSVADCGRGIPNSIRSSYQGELTDEEATHLALEPEVSGSSARPGVNRGVGLYIVRRLTLAAAGSFSVRSNSLVARSSSKTPDALEPSFERVSDHWQGTIVTVVFNAPASQYDRPMRDIVDEIEGRGPTYADLQFFRSSRPEPGWHRVAIGPDRGKFAMDRERARALAIGDAGPALARGECLELDFGGVGGATQAFCHALLVPIVEPYGREVLPRIRFIGASQRTMGPIRFAVDYAIRASPSSGS